MKLLQLLATLIALFTYATPLTAMHVTLAAPPIQLEAIELDTLGEHKQAEITTAIDTETKLTDSEDRPTRLKHLLTKLFPQLPANIINLITDYDIISFAQIIILKSHTTPHAHGIRKTWKIHTIQLLQKNLLAIGSINHPVQFWDLENNEPLYPQKLPCPDLPNGELIETQGIWSSLYMASIVQYRKLLQYTGSSVKAVTALDNGNYAVATEIWSPESWKESTKGAIQIKGTNENNDAAEHANDCCDLADLRPRQNALSGHADSVVALLYFPKDDILVSGCDDGNIKFWNWREEKCLHTRIEHKGSVCALAKLSDKYFASGADRDNLIRIWDVQTSKCVRLMPTSHPLEPRHGIMRINNLLNGLLACLLSDGNWQFWNINQLQPVGMVTYNAQNPVVDIRGIPGGDGFVEAFANGKIEIWR